MSAVLKSANVWAVMPCHQDGPTAELLSDLRARVGGVLLVDDGAPPAVGSRLRSFAEADATELLALGRNRGKGHAIAEGLRVLLAREPRPEAVLLVDADGQHPPGEIPAFLRAAQEADLVVGDRLGDHASMPLARSLCNRVTSRMLEIVTGCQVRDSQCGMRLLRGAALHEVAFRGGRYESETDHLKRCLRRGVRVTWVPIPAIYGDERSCFRPVRDALRVLGALV